MQDVRKESTAILIKASQNLVQVVPQAAFEFWERKDFRLYVKFHSLNKTEQDRMFNEFEISILGLFLLHLEQTISQTDDEAKIMVLSALRKDLPQAFLQLFIDLNIDRKYVDQWKALIDLRLKEYREDLNIAEMEAEKLQDFEKGEKDLRLAWARIETITIDCLRHIRRGHVKKDDHLWKLLRKWFITLDAQLTPITQAKLP